VGGKAILLEISACLKPSEGKQLLSFVSVSVDVALDLAPLLSLLWFPLCYNS